MRSTIRMPKLGDTVDEVLVLGWLVQPGGVVKKGDVLMVVETDKVEADVPTPVGGRLAEQLVAEEDEVKVGAAIAVIES